VPAAVSAAVHDHDGSFDILEAFGDDRLMRKITFPLRVGLRAGKLLARA